MAKSRRDPAAEVAASQSPLLRRMQQSPAPTPPAAEETPVKPSPRKQPAAKTKAPEPADVPKRCLVKWDEADLQDAMAKTLGRQVGTTVQWSAITRAMWSLLLEADEVIARVPAPTLKRPSNGKPEQMAEYEAELAAYLLDIFKAIKK